MYVIAPVSVVDSVLLASTLPETDHAAWSAVTTYALGDRVIVVSTSLAKSTGEAWAAGQDIYWNATSNLATTTVIAGKWIGNASAAAALGTATGTVAVHGVFQSLAASNTGNNPVSNAAGAADKWSKVGATNRWKPFDETISDQATSASNITYTLTVPSLSTGIAFFNVNASSVSVTVKDLAAAVVFTETRALTNTEDIVDWYTFVTWEPDYDTEALFTGLPGYAGYSVEITVAGTNVGLGEIVLGKVIGLGTSLAGTEVGFEDYSRKDRDDWGKAVLVEREYSDTVNFQFSLPITDARRVKRVVSDLRAVPAVWFAGEDLIDRGTTVYGFPAGGLRIPLSVEGRHTASLEIEGLT